MPRMFDKKRVSLTTNEEILMNILWESREPLSCNEIQERAAQMEWNDTYILNTLRSLKKKNMVHVHGLVRHNTQYARKFTADMTREEYAVRLALSTGIRSKAIGETALGLVRAMDVDKEVLKELEDIIGRLEERG